MQYDRWAANYDRRWRDYTEATHAALLAALDLGGVRDLLDAGCGTGALFERLLARDPALRVTGVDPSAGMLTVARWRLADRGVTLLRGEAEHLPLPGDSCDVVVMANVLHYVAQPSAARNEARRVLRPGGRIAMVDYVPRGPLPRLADRLIRCYDRAHRRTRDAPELYGLLRANGYTVIVSRRFPIGPLLRGVVAVAATPEPA